MRDLPLKCLPEQVRKAILTNVTLHFKDSKNITVRFECFPSCSCRQPKTVAHSTTIPTSPENYLRWRTCLYTTNLKDGSIAASIVESALRSEACISCTNPCTENSALGSAASVWRFVQTGTTSTCILWISNIVWSKSCIERRRCRRSCCCFLFRLKQRDCNVVSGQLIPVNLKLWSV